MEDFKEEYKDFTIVRNADGYYSVFHFGDWCGDFTIYSDAIDSVDKFFAYFGGAANVTL